MTICGVIAEYNPLHLGHAYHLSEAKRISGADALVVVMSGPVVQRGECAVADPLARARWAVGAGADLVLELPAAYACHNAQLFARGAVGLLSSIGADAFCFGCESDNMDKLRQAAQLLYHEPEGFSALLKAHLKQGESFPRARQLAMEAYLGDEAAPLLTQANNVLALEYLQACLHFQSQIKPLPVLRKGDGYRDTQIRSSFPSATSIRAALAAGKAPVGLPPPVADELTQRPPVLPSQLGPLIRWMLLSTDPDHLAQLPDMGEGLHLRLIKAAQENMDYESIVKAALTRRYSEPRIKRALLHGLLGMDQAYTELLRRETPLFIRPLAMGQKGPQLLSLLASRTQLPLLTHPGRYRPENEQADHLWTINRHAWQLFALLDGRPSGWELSARLAPLSPWPQSDDKEE